MNKDFIFEKEYVLSFLRDILQTDSPSGYTGPVMEKIKCYAEDLGFSFAYTNKGNGVISLNPLSEPLKDEASGTPLVVKGLCAHVDTLGLMVRSIKSDGSLAVTSVGSPIIPTLDGEYCTVRTRSGKTYSGTILSNQPAAHVYREAQSLSRDFDNIHIRLDEKVKNEADTEKLGVGAGDFIFIDPKTVITDNGFIKSRFLDDKLSVGVLFGVMKYLADKKIQPADPAYILISTYEEVGHGMSAPGVPALTELLAVDMGCIGEDLKCTEYDVSICVKDSSGPYDYELTNRLISLASEHKLNYAVDIYPYYGSDVGAAQTAGYDIKGALIGPGVHASHGMERSHFEALENAMKLVTLYLL